jgi:hypothetical protein
MTLRLVPDDSERIDAAAPAGATTGRRGPDVSSLDR